MADRFEAGSSWFQRIFDHVFFPLNVWLGEDASRRLRLTPIDHERVRMALARCRGRLLDVGCGNNLLVRSYGNGFGCDVHSYAAADLRCDSAFLPFRASSFDTVALLACLNHIQRRSETLTECRRVLRPGGQLLVTMIPRWVGRISHPIRERHDPDQLERGMERGEEPGLSTPEITTLLAGAGFRVVRHRRFLWALNNLYVAEARTPGA